VVITSGTLAHAQVPLAQQPHLLAGVALGDHAGDDGITEVNARVKMNRVKTKLRTIINP
jgi:hypothetical protein